LTHEEATAAQACARLPVLLEQPGHRHANLEDQMKMTIPELFAVLLPPGMEACVAGGYACDPILASDLDVEKPIHVMVTTALTPIQLLCSFDISTHQVAVDERGREIFGPNWTNVMEAPVQLKGTPSTPARLEKITARYAHLRQEAHAS
jgi:hypothetical protein